MFNLNYTWVPIECPNCNYQEEIQLIDAKTEKTIFCHNCKASITLKDDQASVHTSIEQINNVMNDIENIFKNLGK